MPSFKIDLPREAASLRILSQSGNVLLVLEHGHLDLVPLGDGPGINDPLRVLELTAKALEHAIPQVQRQFQAPARQ